MLLSFPGVSVSRRSMAVVIGLVTLASLGIAAYVVPPEQDPDRIWQSVRADLRAGRLDRADAAMKRLVRLRKATADDWLVLGQLAMTLGRADQALADLAHVPDEHAIAPRARLWEGQLELQHDRARAAESSWLRALKRDPGLVPARRALIYLYGMQRRRRELAAQFEALSELDPLSFDQMMVWCLIRVSPWDSREVRPVLEAYVRADPGDCESRVALAEAYRRISLTAEAEETLRDLPASNADARAIRVRMAFDRGDDARVASLLADGPQSHPVLALFRGREAMARGNVADAIRHFRAVLAADPHDPAVLFRLGTALTKLGQVDEGRTFLTAARDHDRLYNLIERTSTAAGRDDVDLHRALASAYQRVGLVPEARAWYRLVLAHDPLDVTAQQALHRLGGSSPPPERRATSRPIQSGSRMADVSHLPSG